MAAPHVVHLVYARVASDVQWWLRTKCRRKGAESGGVSWGARGLLGKSHNRDKAEEDNDYTYSD
jgi:hypothetical protein